MLVEQIATSEVVKYGIGGVFDHIVSCDGRQSTPLRSVDTPLQSDRILLEQ